ncbi:MAG: hypothetical protein P8170_01960 [Gemmatimonadota bacterium]|jgi:hypothetical protein
MKRRTTSVIWALGGLLLVAPGVQGQLNPGVHGARATDAFGGSYGLGVSLELDIPLFPVDFLVAGETFFPDCGNEDGCSFRGASADVHLALPVPMVQPYAAAGVVYRRTDPGGSAEVLSNQGFALGVGVNLRALVLGGYAEVRYEFVDPDDQWIARVGIRF